jgi:O-antigen/teichoic acid export membrane protein
MHLTLAFLVTLKYEMAIVLPKERLDAVHLYILSIITSLFVSLLVLLIIIAFNGLISKLIGNEALSKWLYFIPFTLLFAGITDSSFLWFNRNNEFKQTSISKIIKASFAAFFHILFGLLNFLSGGLIIGFVLGHFSVSIYSFSKAYKKINKHLNQISIKRMKELAISYKNFPLLYTLLGVTNRLSNYLPVFLLNRFFGVTYSGYYGLAKRAISTPSGLIGGSISQVFYRQASIIYNTEKNIYNYLKLTYLRLLKISFLPYLLLFIFAPIIFKFLFGPQWEIAGQFTRILAPWLFLGFINAPSGYSIAILNKQKQMLGIDIAMLICRFAALFAGYKIYGTAIMAVVLFAGVSVLFNIFILFFVLHLAKRNYKTSENL